MEIDSGKLFIGGISWDTTEERLRDYFQTYGEVVEALILKDRVTGRGRGFGFIVFASTSVAEKVLKEKHFIDGRAVEVKRAVPRDEHQNSYKNNGSSIQGSPSTARTKKIFVGGLSATITESEFKKYFQQFGTITDVVVMYDHNTQRPRGFGFITFDSEEAVNKVLIKTFHDLNGKMVEVKVAVPKESSPGTTSSLTGSQNYGLNKMNNFLNAYTQGHSSSSDGGYGMRLDDRFNPVSVGRSGYPPYSPSKYTTGLILNPGFSLNYGAGGDSGLGYIRGISPPYARNPDRHHIRNDSLSNQSVSTSKPSHFGNDSLSNGIKSYESWENTYGNRKTYIQNNQSVSTSKPSHFATSTYREEGGLNIYKGDPFFEDNDWLSSSLEPTGSTSFTYGRGSLSESVESIISAGYIGYYNVLTRSDRGISA